MEGKVGQVTAAFQSKDDSKGVAFHIKQTVAADQSIVVDLGTDLRMQDKTFLAKLNDFSERAQVVHDTKFVVLAIIKANLTTAILVSRIEATKMDVEDQSALIEFIVGNE